jgi:hypothetical protein
MMLHVVSGRSFYTKVVLFAFAVVCLVTPVRSWASVPKEVSAGEQNKVLSNFKSYREWKALKIQEAELKIKILKEKIGEHRGLAADPNLLMKENTNSEAGLSEDLKAQLDREIMNLSLARDMSISDYFVGYLTKQSSPDLAIKDVSSRLTAEEVAELMSAYAQHFFQTRPNSIKVAPRADSGL